MEGEGCTQFCVLQFVQEKEFFNCIQMIIDVRETRCLQFRPFVNTRLNTLISFFGYWFRKIAIRPRDWRVSFLHCPAIAQITVSSVSPVRFRVCRYAVRNEALSLSHVVLVMF